MSEPSFRYTPFPSGPAHRHVAYSFAAKGHIGYRTDKILPTGLVVAIMSFGAGHRLGPDPVPEHNPIFENAWVQGNWTRPLYHTPMNGTGVVGLAIPPQTLMRLTGQPTLRLTDRVAPANAVLPAPIYAAMTALAGRAEDADAHAALHDLVDRTAIHLVAPWIDTLHDRIAAAQGDVDLPRLYAELPVSERKARDAFKDAIGLTPRHAARIQRLLALLGAVDPARNVDWTTLAHAHGFFDQAHFNNEFRKLTGLYPSKYLDDRRIAYPDARRGEHVSFTPQDVP